MSVIRGFVFVYSLGWIRFYYLLNSIRGFICVCSLGWIRFLLLNVLFVFTVWVGLGFIIC